MDTTEKRIVPEELDNLIQEYLTDGIISAKERQVLLNKAQALGLNLDEVDLYIDAQQQKADQAVAAAVNKRRGKTCPFCGSSIPELTDKCPNCGSNITPEASEELAEIIEHLESALVNFKSGEDIDKSKAEVERYARQARMYYGNNPKIQRLLEEIETESENTELKNQRKKKRKRCILACIATLIVIIIGIKIGSSYYTPIYKDQVKTTQKVRECVANNDFDGAKDYIREYVEKNKTYIIQNSKNPEMSEAVNVIINAYIQQDKLEEAKDYMTAMINQDGKWEFNNGYGVIPKDCFTNVAKAFVDKGDYDQAFSMLERNLYNDLISSCDIYFNVIYYTIDKMKENNKNMILPKYVVRWINFFVEESESKYAVTKAMAERKIREYIKNY